MIRKSIYAIALLIGFASAASGASTEISMVLLEESIDELYGPANEINATSMERAFIDSKIWPANGGSKTPGENGLFVRFLFSSFVKFDGYYSYALPVELQLDDTQNKLIINSYLVKSADKRKKNFIFFPIASAFNEKKEFIQTLLPTEESGVKGNTISNVIEIPDGTKFLLIHTHPDYVTYVPDGSEADSKAVKQGVAGMFGAIGGIFNGVLGNLEVERGKAVIAPVGVVEVMKYKRKR